MKRLLILALGLLTLGGVQIGQPSEIERSFTAEDVLRFAAVSGGESAFLTGANVQTGGTTPRTTTMAATGPPAQSRQKDRDWSPAWSIPRDPMICCVRTAECALRNGRRHAHLHPWPRAA